MANNITIISECLIKPKYVSEDSKLPYHLTPWDLVYTSTQPYIQNGLLYAKPVRQAQGDYEEEAQLVMKTLLENLKESLSHVLVQFYPLAGRLVAVKTKAPPESYSFHVDCSGSSSSSSGVKFIHAKWTGTAELTISHIMSLEGGDVPTSTMHSFFHDDRAVEDLESKRLLSIAVTELVDGVFIACSMSHIVADGNSFWHFFNMWSEVFQQQVQVDSSNKDIVCVKISRPPILKRWFPDGHDPPMLNVPFTPKNDIHSIMKLYEAPKLTARIFRLSAETIAKLKANANAEYSTCTNSNNKKTFISSYQSVSAFFWRSITRVRRLPPDEMTFFFLAINNRSRLEPPLSQDYFRNSVHTIPMIAKAGELSEKGVGWVAWQLHQAVANYSDKQVRQWLHEWLQSPYTWKADHSISISSVLVNDCTKFNISGNEFGILGKPIAFNFGDRTHMIDGYVYAYSDPDPAAAGDILVEVSLLPHTMRDLQSDQEFMQFIS
nr:uncharacterized acetyltransferase At3g50280-like [Ziziphus jujuba var. spinosa]